MKDLTSVFACADAKKAQAHTANLEAAIEAAARCCIESTADEWVFTPTGLRLPLQQGVWLAFDVWDDADTRHYNVLYLERVRRNRRGKSRGVQRSYNTMHNATELTKQLNDWGITP